MVWGHQNIRGCWCLNDFGQKEGFKTKTSEKGKMIERARESQENS